MKVEEHIYSVIIPISNIIKIINGVIINGKTQVGIIIITGNIHLPGLLAGILLASISTMAPVAMANPQPQEGRVAVGPIGSATRSWVSVADAQRLCQQRGCWITDGVEVAPGNWVPNTLFPGAKPVKDESGNGLLEVRPSR